MFKLIFVCLAALLVAQTNAQVIAAGASPIVGGGMPVVAGASPMMPVGGAAVVGRTFLGGPITLGRAMPAVVAAPIVPAARIIVVPVRRPVVVVPVRRPFGKREIMANMTECVLSSESSKIVCTGANELSCDLAYNFTGLGSFSFLIKELALHKVDMEVVDKVKVDVKETSLDANVEKVETIKQVTKHIEPIYQFLAEEEIVEHKIVSAAHTFVNPTDNKPVILSLYWNEDMSSCLGFRFKEHTCWEKFEHIVEVTKPQELDFQIVMSQLIKEEFNFKDIKV